MDTLSELIDPTQFSELKALGNVVLGMILGGLIGLEREHADKPAGFRTHMLVAGAATLLVVLADDIGTRFSHEHYAQALRIDPLRIIEAIITGISFLGAGTIFRSGHGSAVHGLTTAASLLLAGAIGIAVALNKWLLAVCVTALVLIVLFVFSWFDRRIGD